jgi:hypothetical protein
MHGVTSLPATKYPRAAQSKFPGHFRHLAEHSANRDKINHSPFNLDNLPFIRYIYFKCNKTSAGALIRSRLSIMMLMRAAAQRDRQAAEASI